mgnify:FL=1
MRVEWTILFANGGKEALDHFDRGKIDVIVSDMRMPGMDGAALLKEVEKRDPTVIRLILSGQASYEEAIRLVGVCQQFLAKPCDCEELIARIRQALSLRQILGDPALQALIGGLHDLPSPPEAYHTIVEELRQPQASLIKVADLVSRDVALSTKLLQIARWGYFGAQRNINTVGQAVGLLGIERVRSLVLSHGILNHYDGKDLGGVSLAQFSHHSLATANLAQGIAQIENMEIEVVEQAFVAGLLHDIGSLVLSINNHEGCQTLMLDEEAGFRQRLSREMELFGGTHMIVGAYLAGLWGLPYDVIETIAYHHDPSLRPQGAFDVLTIVHAADALLEGAHRDRNLSEALDFEYLKAAGVADRLTAWADVLVEQNGRTAES